MTTPPTENKDEREHARLINAICDEREHCLEVACELASVGGLETRTDAIADALFDERAAVRAAADKAGYERGREAGRKLSFDEVRDVVVQDKMQSARELNALQSQHARLIVSAREAEQAMRVAAAKLQEKHGYEPLAIKECANVLRDLVDAALAETLEEKKT